MISHSPCQTLLTTASLHSTILNITYSLLSGISHAEQPKMLSEKAHAVPSPRLPKAQRLAILRKQRMESWGFTMFYIMQYLEHGWLLRKNVVRIERTVTLKTSKNRKKKKQVGIELDWPKLYPFGVLVKIWSSSFNENPARNGDFWGPTT